MEIIATLLAEGRGLNPGLWGGLAIVIGFFTVAAIIALLVSRGSISLFQRRSGDTTRDHGTHPPERVGH